MRDLARQVSIAYVEQREREGYPWLAENGHVTGQATTPLPSVAGPATPAAFFLEIGTEELPSADVVDGIAQLESAVPRLLDGLRLAHGPVTVTGTPRRLVVCVETLAPMQPDEETLVKGPPAERAYDQAGNLTQAALGFARSRGVRPEELEVRQEGSGRYVFAIVRNTGRPTVEILYEALPGLIGGLKFGKNMRWNASNVAFSRPIRWLVALFGDAAIPFNYAGLVAGAVTRGARSGARRNWPFPPPAWP